MRRALPLITLALASLALISLTPWSGADTAEDAPLVQVFECAGLTFTVEIKSGEAWIFLPDYSGPLPLVTSASGTKYEANNITFWSVGEEASLDYGKQRYAECRNNRQLAVWEAAKLKGADFRAVGNEPGWVLEITGDSLSLIADSGNSEYAFDGVERQSDETSQATTYRGVAGDDSITVTLQGQTCQDTMADTSYETTVTIELNEQTLRGCGRPLH